MSSLLPADHATRVRYTMIASTTLVAIMLYLDRACLSILDRQIYPVLFQISPEASDGAAMIASPTPVEALELAKQKERFALLGSAFFWSYALCQIPAGWLGDRFGARRVLTAYLFLWSAATFCMGFADGFVAFFILRLLCGMFEAGAYPLAAGIVKRWMPFSKRALGSSLVAVGGRFGGAIAGPLTIALTTAAIDGWQRPFFVYGLIGMVGALVFFSWYRDDPSTHPAVNEAEVKLIGNQPKTTQALGWPPLGAFARSRSLWLMSVVQFMSNFAWVFILTLFPAYLTEVFKTPDTVKGNYQLAILCTGIVGMIFGGWLTDRLVHTYGLRWGRMIPLIGSKAIVAIAWVGCIFVNDPLVFTLMMCLVAWGTDLGNPPMWAFSQDVGGRHIGGVLGWANMWGNIGAAVAPILLAIVSNRLGWGAAFGLCALSQLIAALAALGIDATKPILKADEK
jgi:ACS family glucarate transporter-like MFS transporter